MTLDTSTVLQLSHLWAGAGGGGTHLVICWMQCAR